MPRKAKSASIPSEPVRFLELRAAESPGVSPSILKTWRSLGIASERAVLGRKTLVYSRTALEDHLARRTVHKLDNDTDQAAQGEQP